MRALRSFYCCIYLSLFFFLAACGGSDETARIQSEDADLSVYIPENFKVKRLSDGARGLNYTDEGDGTLMGSAAVTRAEEASVIRETAAFFARLQENGLLLGRTADEGVAEVEASFISAQILDDARELNTLYAIVKLETGRDDRNRALNVWKVNEALIRATEVPDQEDQGKQPRGIIARKGSPSTDTFAVLFCAFIAQGAPFSGTRLVFSANVLPLGELDGQRAIEGREICTSLSTSRAQSVPGEDVFDFDEGFAPPRADIQLIIDNSDSMVTERAAMLAALAKFVRRLEDGGNEYHMYVTTTQHRASTRPELDTPASRAEYELFADEFPGLVPPLGNTDATNRRFVAYNDPPTFQERLDAILSMAQVNGGGTDETVAGRIAQSTVYDSTLLGDLLPWLPALDDSEDSNNNGVHDNWEDIDGTGVILREGVPSVFIGYTDEIDHSPEGADGVLVDDNSTTTDIDLYVRNFDALTAAKNKQVFVFGVTGPFGTSCEASLGTAQRGDRLRALANAYDGVTGDICADSVDEFDPVFTAIAQKVSTVSSNIKILTSNVFRIVRVTIDGNDCCEKATVNSTCGGGSTGQDDGFVYDPTAQTIAFYGDCEDKLAEAQQIKVQYLAESTE